MAILPLPQFEADLAAQQEADRNHEENPNPRDMIPGFLGGWRFAISERPGRFFVNSGSNG